MEQPFVEGCIRAPLEEQQERFSTVTEIKRCSLVCCVAALKWTKKVSFLLSTDDVSSSLSVSFHRLPGAELLKIRKNSYLNLSSTPSWKPAKAQQVRRGRRASEAKVGALTDLANIWQQLARPGRCTHFTVPTSKVRKVCVCFQCRCSGWFLVRRRVDQASLPR